VASPAPVAGPSCGRNATPGGSLTTSFLSICSNVKDNRILPDGFLPRDQRVEIAKALGADEDLALEAGAYAVGEDPDYVSGGSDSLTYEVPLSALGGRPASVKATLHYQAIPPFYLGSGRPTGAVYVGTLRAHERPFEVELRPKEPPPWETLERRSIRRRRAPESSSRSSTGVRVNTARCKAGWRSGRFGSPARALRRAGTA